MEFIWKDKKRTFLGLPLSFTTYEMDEERLFIRSGLFTQTEDEVRLYRILDVTLTRTLGQRICGVGTIHCCSSDATRKEFDIKSVKNPREVKDLLSRKVEEQREKKRIYQREILTIDDEHDDHACDT
ncbi:MAG: PH domain-containing protein [Oscillospiraceae bacterium]|nr:PH domain-containing protein [Oscillospiraceae bacterium]